MILAQVQAYINDNGPITMHQITKHFGMEAQALQGMLQILMRKGLIEQLQQAPTCNGCTSCDGHLQISYQKPVSQNV